MATRHPIQGRLLIHWLILCIALGILGGVLAWDLHKERRFTESREADRLRAQARVIHDNVASNIFATDRVLLGLRDELSGRKTAPRLNERLGMLSDAIPGVRTILVLDRQGIVRAANRQELVGKDFSGRAYFLRPARHPVADTMYVSPPFMTALGVYGINLVRTIHDGSGGFAGIVAATLDPDYFRSLLHSVLYSEDMWDAIAHDSGIQFMMEPPREGQAGKNLAQPGSFFTRHIDSGVEENVLTGLVYSTSEERMMALRTVRIADVAMDGTLVVAAGRDLAAIFDPWRRDARNEVLLFLLLAALASASLFAYQRRLRLFEQRQAEAEAQRRESERFIEAVADNIPCMLGYWNREMRCDFANAGYLEWFGKTREQMRGLHIKDLLGEDLFRLNLPYIQAALAGERRQFERVLTKPNGDVGHVWATYVPDRQGDAVRGFFVLVTDITELKRAQQRLLLQSEITANAAEGVMLVSASDSTINYVNRKFEAMFGYASHELLGRHVSILNASAEKTPEEAAAAIDGELVRNGTWSGEILSRKKDGTPFWTYANVSAFQHPELGTLWISHQSDLTERKAAETALHERESRYRVAVETALDGFWLTDAEGRFIEVNDAYVRYSGYSREELLTMRIPDVEAQERPEETAAHIATIKELGYGRFESLHRKKDGSVWPVEIATTFLPTAGGRFFVFVADLTERKRIERELLASQEQLRQLAIYDDHMWEEERKRIAREVHDELGQLLTALKMNASLLQMQYDRIPGVFETTEKMLALIESTIKVARQVTSNLRPPALDAGLAGALEWLADDFAGRSRARCRVDCRLPERSFGEALETTVFRIAQEALTNVARHSGADVVSISLAVSGDNLALEIADDGIGFDPEAIAHARGSFGLLGMRERVAALHGKLSIVSGPGTGTRISIELPLSGTSR